MSDMLPCERICDCVCEMKHRGEKKRTAAPGNEDWISLVASAVQIFPSVSIATATSRSLTEQSMTHRLVTNKSSNETLTERRKAGHIHSRSFRQNAVKKRLTRAVRNVVIRGLE